MSKQLDGLAGEYLLKLAKVASRIDLFKAVDRDTNDRLWFLTCIAEYGYVYRYKGLTVTSVLKLAVEEIKYTA